MHRLFLIRHGQSWTNAGRGNIAPQDVGLTTMGNEQARRIAAFLKDYASLTLMVTSSYLRTKQTAEPTKREFRSVPLEEWDVQEFTYLSPAYFGYSTIHDRRPLVDAYWEQKDPTYEDEDGKDSESFIQFINRVQNFIMQMNRRLNKTTLKNENIAVFSHEQFINAVLWYIKYRPTTIDAQAMMGFRNYFHQNRIPNGTIEELKFRRNQDGWTLEFTEEHLKPPVQELISANLVSGIGAGMP